MHKSREEKSRSMCDIPDHSGYAAKTTGEKQCKR